MLLQIFSTPEDKANFQKFGNVITAINEGSVQIPNSSGLIR